MSAAWTNFTGGPSASVAESLAGGCDTRRPLPPLQCHVCGVAASTHPPVEKSQSKCIFDLVKEASASLPCRASDFISPGEAPCSCEERRVYWQRGCSAPAIR